MAGHLQRKDGLSHRLTGVESDGWERVNRKLSLGVTFEVRLVRESGKCKGFQAGGNLVITLCVPEELHEGMRAGGGCGWAGVRRRPK